MNKEAPGLDSELHTVLCGVATTSSSVSSSRTLSFEPLARRAPTHKGPGRSEELVLLLWAVVRALRCVSGVCFVSAFRPGVVTICTPSPTCLCAQPVWTAVLSYAQFTFETMELAVLTAATIHVAVRFRAK